MEEKIPEICLRLCKRAPVHPPCTREFVLVIHLGRGPKKPLLSSLLSYQVLVWRALQMQVGRSGAAWPGRGGRGRGACRPREGRTCGRWHLVRRGEMTHGQRDARGREGHTHTQLHTQHTCALDTQPQPDTKIHTCTAPPPNTETNHAPE